MYSQRRKATWQAWYNTTMQPQQPKIEIVRTDQSVSLNNKGYIVITERAYAADADTNNEFVVAKKDYLVRDDKEQYIERLKEEKKALQQNHKKEIQRIDEQIKTAKKL